MLGTLTSYDVTVSEGRILALPRLVGRRRSGRRRGRRAGAEARAGHEGDFQIVAVGRRGIDALHGAFSCCACSPSLAT